MADLNGLVPKQKTRRSLSIMTGVLALALVMIVSISVLQGVESYKKYFTGAISTASVSVGNLLPFASTATLTGNGQGGTEIDLTEGTTTTSVTVGGSVTDYNGCLDLKTVVVKVYTGLLSACTATNYTTCYVITDSSPATDLTCTVGGVSNTTYTVNSTNHPLVLQYFANPGQWKATIIPYDSSVSGLGGLGTTTDSSAITLADLTALGVSSSITYGSVPPGSASTSDHTATVTNSGNVAIDYNLSGTDLSCIDNSVSRGSIPVSDEQYCLGSFAYNDTACGSSGQYSVGNLSATPTKLTVALAPQTLLTPTSTVDSYWQISIPNGVSGTCSGNVSFTAVAH